MLELQSHFVASLPGDPLNVAGTRTVLGACWSPVDPTPVAAPSLVAMADEVRALLGLPADAAEDPALIDVLAGNRTPDGARPYAACYGGHQFGHWAGQLGDGRAIVLGERLGADGRRWEVQLKGAGPTPYSRHADGRAVLRSSVREFLCSEAMAHLGVPTTRALALVTTGEGVVRDMFYDGRPRVEPGAVVTRVAPSFLRFGSYEIHAARGDLATLGALVDHTLAAHFPELGPRTPESVVALYAEVMARTARLVASWQGLGFVHGVMNTDNLSILGLTIDYGPYGWLEGYDPNWTPNTSDSDRRRYHYANQPQVAGWNLARLAEALAPLVGDPEPFQIELDAYGPTVESALDEVFARKLALPTPDDVLLVDLFRVMTIVETDWTLFFRMLARVRPDDDDARLLAPLAEAFYTPPTPDGAHRIAGWVRQWLRFTEPDPAKRRAIMDAANPRYVLRNWLAQLAIDRAERGDVDGVRELLDVLRHPYDDQPGRDAYAARRPEWARNRAGCSMLSCSS
ncbi:MAG: YdiU family protein [Myxococcales bacterium]|nr:YdiU family protein [Myxococcales bacterium]